MSGLIASKQRTNSRDEIELIKWLDEILEKVKKKDVKLTTNSFKTYLDTCLSYIDSKNSELIERLLYFLGFLLSDDFYVNTIEEVIAVKIIDEICNVSGFETSKLLAQKALWCLSTSKLKDVYYEQCFVKIRKFLQRIFFGDRTISPLAYMEAVSLCHRLVKINETEFFSPNFKAIDLVFNFCGSYSQKVRFGAFKFLEDYFDQLKKCEISQFKEPLSLIAEALCNMIKFDDPKFAIKVWTFIIRLLSEHLANNSILKLLLPVPEAGFKSEEHEIRCLTLEAWRTLISILLSTSKVGELKCATLLVQPLIYGSKTDEHIAKEKLSTWCHLLNALSSNLENYFEKVCLPFLRFCIGGEYEVASTSKSELSTPKTNRNLKTPVTPDTPKLYLRNRPSSVGPKVLPTFPSVQSFVGEIILDILCGDEAVPGFERKLSLRLRTPCLKSSKLFADNFMLVVQCLRIWTNSLNVNMPLLIRCWKQMNIYVKQCKQDLPPNDFELLYDNYLQQFRQFLLEFTGDKKALNELKELLHDVEHNLLKSLHSSITSPVSKSKPTRDADLNEPIMTLKPNEQISAPVSHVSSLEKSESTPVQSTITVTRRNKRTHKKLNLDSSGLEEEDKNEFVYVLPVEKKQMVLTEHQQEKFCERKEMPFLNRLESQSVDYDHIDRNQFVTESQLLHDLATDNDDSCNTKSTCSVTKDSCQSKNPVVVLTKLADYEISILSRGRINEEINDNCKLANNSTKFRKSKSESDVLKNDILAPDSDESYKNNSECNEDMFTSHRRSSRAVNLSKRFDDFVLDKRVFPNVERNRSATPPEFVKIIPDSCNEISEITTLGETADVVHKTTEHSEVGASKLFPQKARKSIVISRQTFSPPINVEDDDDFLFATDSLESVKAVTKWTKPARQKGATRSKNKKTTVAPKSLSTAQTEVLGKKSVSEILPIDVDNEEFNVLGRQSVSENLPVTVDNAEYEKDDLSKLATEKSATASATLSTVARNSSFETSKIDKNLDGKTINARKSIQTMLLKCRSDNLVFCNELHNLSSSSVNTSELVDKLHPILLNEKPVDNVLSINNDSGLTIIHTLQYVRDGLIEEIADDISNMDTLPGPVEVHSETVESDGDRDCLILSINSEKRAIAEVAENTSDILCEPMETFVSPNIAENDSIQEEEITENNFTVVKPFRNSTESSDKCSTPKKTCGNVNISSIVNNEEIEEIDCLPSKFSKFQKFSPRSTPSANGILRRKRDRAEFEKLSFTPPSTKRQVHFAPESVYPQSDDELGKVVHSPKKRARLDLSFARNELPLGASLDSSLKEASPSNPVGFTKRFSARTHAMISLLTAKSKADDLNDSSLSSSADDQIVMTSESVLNNSLPVWPTLVNDRGDVSQVVDGLVASAWTDGLLEELRLKNISTIGDLARLTELDAHYLPIKQPKLNTLKGALENYELSLAKQQPASDVDDSSYFNVSDILPVEDRSEVINAVCNEEYVQEKTNETITAGEHDADNSCESVEKRDISPSKNNNEDNIGNVGETNAVSLDNLNVENVQTLTKYEKLKLHETLQAEMQELNEKMHQLQEKQSILFSSFL